MLYLNVPDKYIDVAQEIFGQRRQTRIHTNINSTNLTVQHPVISDEGEVRDTVRNGTSYYIRSWDISYICAPLILSGYDIDVSDAKVIHNEDEENYYIEQINNFNFETLDDNFITVSWCYTNDFNTTKAKLLETGLFVDTVDTQQNIYNKYLSQVLERLFQVKYNFTILKSKIKHKVIVLTDFFEDNLLHTNIAIGSIPYIFPDVGEKIHPNVKAYCDALLRRGQLKRPTNQFVMEAFTFCLEQTEFPIDLVEIKTTVAMRNILNARKNAAQRELNEEESNARRHLTSYQGALTRYNEALIRLNNIEKNSDTFLNDYKTVLGLKGIVDVKLMDSMVLEISLKKTLNNFDTDIASCLLHNIDNRIVRKIFEDVFVTQKYKMYVFAKYYYRLSPNNGLDDPSGVSYSILRDNKAMFNPHFQYFHCLGAYRPELIKANQNGNLLAFANIALASVGSINLADSPVINRFIVELTDAIEFLNEHRPLNEEKLRTFSTIAQIPCIENEEGSIKSIYELYMAEAETNVAAAQTIEPVDLFATEDEDYEDEEDYEEEYYEEGYDEDEEDED